MVTHMCNATHGRLIYVGVFCRSSSPGVCFRSRSVSIAWCTRSVSITRCTHPSVSIRSAPSSVSPGKTFRHLQGLTKMDPNSGWVGVSTVHCSQSWLPAREQNNSEVCVLLLAMTIVSCPHIALFSPFCPCPLCPDHEHDGVRPHDWKDHPAGWRPKSHCVRL
jgi:hypothetical protein